MAMMQISLGRVIALACALSVAADGQFGVIVDRRNPQGFLGGGLDLLCLFLNEKLEYERSLKRCNDNDDKPTGIYSVPVPSGEKLSLLVALGPNNTVIGETPDGLFTFTGTLNPLTNTGTMTFTFSGSSGPGTFSYKPGTGGLPGAITLDLGLGRTNGSALVSLDASNDNSLITADPVQTANGQLISNYIADLSLGGPLRLFFRRYYASLLKLNGITSALGDNWMHNFDQKLYVNGTNATVVLFRGGTVRFAQSGGAWNLVFTPRRSYQLVQSGSNYRFLDPSSNLIYTFSAAGDLIKIEDRNGNALTVTPSATGPTQVADGLGRSLTFTYDAAGKISRVQDQTGRAVQFAHAGADLTGATDALGNMTTFAYTTAGFVKSVMTKATRPAGNIPYTQAADTTGRVNRQTDSLGNATTLAFNSVTPGTTVITDPLSNAERHVYLNLTDLATRIDAAGKASTVTYDSARRPLSLTDRLEYHRRYVSQSLGLHRVDHGRARQRHQLRLCGASARWIHFLQPDAHPVRRRYFRELRVRCIGQCREGHRPGRQGLELYLQLARAGADGHESGRRRHHPGLQRRWNGGVP